MAVILACRPKRCRRPAAAYSTRKPSMGRPQIPTLRHGRLAMQPPRLRGTGPLFALTRLAALAALAKAVCLTALQGRYIALAASFCHLGPKKRRPDPIFNGMVADGIKPLRGECRATRCYGAIGPGRGFSAQPSAPACCGHTRIHPVETSQTRAQHLPRVPRSPRRQPRAPKGLVYSFSREPDPIAQWLR